MPYSDTSVCLPLPHLHPRPHLHEVDLWVPVYLMRLQYTTPTYITIFCTIHTGSTVFPGYLNTTSTPPNNHFIPTSFGHLFFVALFICIICSVAYFPRVLLCRGFLYNFLTFYGCSIFVMLLIWYIFGLYFPCMLYTCVYSFRIYFQTCNFHVCCTVVPIDFVYFGTCSFPCIWYSCNYLLCYTTVLFS